MIYGLDYLGLARYPRIAARDHPKGWAAGCFAETFGDAREAAKELLATGRVPKMRVHLLWSDTHEFGDKDMAALQRLASQWDEIARGHKNTAFELSPFCEHNLKNPDKYLDWVKHFAPSCTPVNTPWNGALSKKYKNEIHGTKKEALKGNYNFSFDGDGCVDADSTRIKRRHRKCDTFYWWSYQFNLRKNDNDPTPRPEREAVPTPDLIDSIIYLRKQRGQVVLPKGWLWKSHADQHEAPIPEPRAFKPVMIGPLKASKLEVCASNGQVICTMPYYGPFADGRHRYYAPAMGYQLAEKAIRIQGSAVCKVFADGKLIGRINPAFREGEFR
jgi:hypothetical protein